MQTKDIMKVLDKIDDMKTITEVELDFGEVKISVKRSLVTNEPASEPVYPAFEKASTSSALSTPMENQDPNIATPGQIKFARDLVFKVLTLTTLTLKASSTALLICRLVAFEDTCSVYLFCIS